MTVPGKGKKGNNFVIDAKATRDSKLNHRSVSVVKIFQGSPGILDDLQDFY